VRGRVQVGDDDVRALGGEPVGVRAADAGTATGDEDDLVAVSADGPAPAC
jgi:hypothetical protein